MPVTPEQFHGAWQLVDWRIEYSDGKITRPFGNDPVGQIQYTSDGYMSATVSMQGRDSLSIDNIRQASEGKKAAGFSSYFHYAGQWHVEGESIVHSVDMALNPSMVGTLQRRKATFSNDGELTLSASEPLTNGERREHILQWKRP